jgi:hypothetical protein
MTWVKIDDGFLEHTKIQALSDRALRLHLAGLCSCARRLSDGKLSTLDVDVCRVVAGKATPKHIDELVQAGLWKHARGGYEINDYLDYNPPAERVKAERERWAEVKRKQRAA